MRGTSLSLLTAVLFAVAARAQEAPAPDDISPEARLKRGANLFEYGDCGGALEVLVPLASAGQLKDEAQQVEVHRMLGVCFYQLGKIADASRELNSLLYIDPDYTLDPFLTPPPVVELFEAQKAGIRQKLAEIKAARDQNGEQKPLPGVLVERTTVVRETPFATIFLPFGLAQAANGELVKGVVVGAVQGGLLLTNIGTYWAQMAISKPAGASRTLENESDLVAYTTLQYISGGALVVAVGAYLYGVGDAWWFREDRAVVETKEQKRDLSPDEMKAARGK